MAGTLKKVRFVRAFKQYRVGDEITPNGTLRDWLVSNGYVEILEGGGAGERPMKLGAKAAKKIGEAVKSGKSMFG